MRWIVLSSVAALISTTVRAAEPEVKVLPAGSGAAEIVHSLMTEPERAVRVADGAPVAEGSLIHEAIVNAPPAEMWRVFSTGDGFKVLGVAKCDVDLRLGGLIRSSYDPKADLDGDGGIHNQILAFEPGRMMAWHIAKPPKGFPFMNAYKHTWSVATFTDLGDGRTHVRLAGMGYGDDEESRKMRAFFKAGNQWVMDKLVAAYAPKVDTDATPTMPKTDAHSEGPLDPIDVTEIIPGPRADVYEMYTSSAGWKAFIGVESKIERRVGGPMEIYFGGADLPEGSRGSEGCTVLSFVPGEMFSYTWNAPPTMPRQRAERTWVVVTFEAVNANATRVHVRHMGFAENGAAQKGGATAEEWAQVRSYFVNAWPRVLGAIKAQWEKK